MPSTGDINANGEVFICKNNNFKSGEYWMPMEKFLLKYGSDFYEKKARAKANKEARIAAKGRAVAKRLWELENADKVAKEKDTRDRLRKERLKQKNIERYHATKHLTVGKRKQAQRESHARMLLDPVRLEKHRAKQARAKKKDKEKRAAKRAKRDAERKAKQEALQKIKQEQAEARRIEKAKIAAEKALAKSLRPKRIALTEEQRKEKRKLEKRNYKHVRRARINNCEVKATPKMVEDDRKLAGDRCYYCGKKAELTLDHFEPLAKGGAHCLSNFVFACHPCNSRKRDLDPFEFIAANVPAGFHD
jgi:5-methylcytosine-specific restriction endonuclease McrA